MNKQQERERYATSKLGSTSAHVVPSAISNSRSTRKTIVYPSTSTMDRTTTSHSSWSSSRQCLEISKSFQPPKTRKCRSSTTAFNSRTRWSSSAVHCDPLWHRHSVGTSICMCTPNNNYASTASHEVNNGVTSTSIYWHGKNPCSTVSSNRTTHWTTIPSFLLVSNVLMIWRERWCPKTNMITWWSCGRPSTSRYGRVLRVVQCTRCDSHGWCIRTFPKHHIEGIRCWSNAFHHSTTNGLFALLEGHHGRRS